MLGTANDALIHESVHPCTALEKSFASRQIVGELLPLLPRQDAAPTGPPVARRVADDEARRVGATDRADSAAGQGWPVSGTRPLLAKSEAMDGRRPRHRGCVSLVTFFAQAKKVTRSPAGRVEALHLNRGAKSTELDSGLRWKDEHRSYPLAHRASGSSALHEENDRSGQTLV